MACHLSVLFEIIFLHVYKIILGVIDLTFVVIIQEQLESVIYANSYADGGIRDVIFSPDGKYIFTTGFDVSLCCFKLRFVATV